MSLGTGLHLHARGEVALTDEQRDTLAAVTRAASTLSAIGVITIITTFSLSRHFRNPMHRLIFINAFYNAFDVVCTMISVSGYADGNKSALCQFQGFLNQMYALPVRLTTCSCSSRLPQQELTVLTLQVPSCGCPLDPRHGHRCLPDCLSLLRRAGTEEIRVEVHDWNYHIHFYPRGGDALHRHS